MTVVKNGKRYFSNSLILLVVVVSFYAAHVEGPHDNLARFAPDATLPFHPDLEPAIQPVAGVWTLGGN